MAKKRTPQRPINIALSIFGKLQRAYHNAAAKQPKLKKRDFYTQVIRKGLEK